MPPNVSDPFSKGADPHPDPAPFFGDLQDANKKKVFLQVFMLFLFEGKSTSFFKEKNQKKLQYSRNQGFSSFFAC